jgi:hypothetical protein
MCNVLIEFGSNKLGSCMYIEDLSERAQPYLARETEVYRRDGPIDLGLEEDESGRPPGMIETSPEDPSHSNTVGRGSGANGALEVERGNSGNRLLKEGSTAIAVG